MSMHPVAVARRRGRRRNAVGVFLLFVALVAWAVWHAIGVLLADPTPKTDSATAVTTEEVRFASPDKSLGCQLTPTFARCDVRAKSWAPPPIPPECADPAAWGNAMMVAAEAPLFFCAGQSMLEAPTVLDYGDSVTRGDFQCSSRSSAMRCTNTKTQHGFSVSQTAYTLF